MGWSEEEEEALDKELFSLAVVSIEAVISASAPSGSFPRDSVRPAGAGGETGQWGVRGGTSLGSIRRPPVRNGHAWEVFGQGSRTHLRVQPQRALQG